MNLAALALKSLWRHPLAAGLRLAGLGATTAVMLVWGTLSKGFTTTLRTAVTTLELGDFQLHHPAYRKSQDFYDTMGDADALRERLATVGFASAPRLFAAALAASGDESAGVRLQGVDVEAESRVTTLHEHIESGAWLAASAPAGAVVGRTLARQLDLGLGKEIVILGHAADGSLVTEILIVRGVLAPVNRDVDARGVYVPSAHFRDMFLMPSGVHELALKAPPDMSLAIASRTLTDLRLTGVDVASWRDLKPLLARMIDLLSVTVFFTLGFTYVAIGGMTLNLMFMTVYGRMREYGVMQALGMTPRSLVALVLAETLWTAVFAAAIGVILGLPVATHLERSGLDFSFLIDRLTFAGVTLGPVMRANVTLSAVLAPVIFLLVSTPLFALYPALDAARTAPVDAMRHV